jgi:type I site-specific restriction endonuclease
VKGCLFIRTVEAILLTMATGTGKTFVAFQICWKLWSSRWNRLGEHRRPRILYLADRNILVDQPKDGLFAAFGDARYKIDSGEGFPICTSTITPLTNRLPSSASWAGRLRSFRTPLLQENRWHIRLAG